MFQEMGNRQRHIEYQHLSYPDQGITKVVKLILILNLLEVSVRGILVFQLLVGYFNLLAIQHLCLNSMHSRPKSMRGSDSNFYFFLSFSRPLSIYLLSNYMVSEPTSDKRSRQHNYWRLTGHLAEASVAVVNPVWRVHTCWCINRAWSVCQQISWLLCIDPSLGI